MLKADLASLFGRHEFFIRRLHSFTGLVPVGGFMVFHLATNASIADGVEIFQYRVNVIHGLGPSTIMMLEWPFIFLPILFHAIVGMMIVSRGKRNVLAYPYPENIRYTLQRWTGVIAFFFIFWHVFHMHGWLKFEWWVNYVAKPLGGHQFDPAAGGGEGHRPQRRAPGPVHHLLELKRQEIVGQQLRIHRTDSCGCSHSGRAPQHSWNRV